MSTCHPQIQAWAVSKPILVLLNRMDAISADDQKAWGHHFARQQQPVFWTNAAEGTGVLKVRDFRLSDVPPHALGVVLCQAAACANAEVVPGCKVDRPVS